MNNADFINRRIVPPAKTSVSDIVTLCAGQHSDCRIDPINMQLALGRP